jgi:hypothetical protein
VKRAAAAILALALLARLIYGRGTLGYDAAWALVWGDQLAHGELPALDAPGAPTPHPLANVVSAILAPLGTAGIELVIALSWLSLGALGWLAFRLGAELYSVWVGTLFAALLLTRPLLVLEAGQAVIDVPFLALVLAAMLAEARRPRTGWTVPVLLALAGLLRPEAWLLAIAWAAWALPVRADRVAVVAAAFAAPLLWVAFDFAATGDPLHSLHGTQDLAAQLERPRELDTALRATPSYLRFALTSPVVWLGLAGCLLAITRLYERTLLPAAVAGLGLITFLVLGATGLPLLSRYVLLPAVMLALWCAVAALGFTIPGASGRVWSGAAVIALVLLAAGLPSLRDELRRARGVVDSRADVERALTAILDEPAVRAALKRCTISVPDDRPRPLVALRLDAPVELRARDGVTVNYATPAARASYRIGPAPQPGLPPGTRRLAGNDMWVASAAPAC